MSVNFAPCSIGNSAQLGRRAAALRQDLKRFTSGDDALQNLLSAKRRFVDEVRSQTLDVTRSDLRPDDGVPSLGHVFAAFSSAIFARRRTSAVEWTLPVLASESWLCAKSFSIASVS